MIRFPFTRTGQGPGAIATEAVDLSRHDGLLFPLAFPASHLLHGWTGHTSIGAEYTAVTWFGLKQGFTSRAGIVPLAGIRRHLQHLGITAYRTGQQGFKLHKYSSITTIHKVTDETGCFSATG